MLVENKVYLGKFLFLCFFSPQRFPFVAVSIGFVVNKEVCYISLWLAKCPALLFLEKVFPHNKFRFVYSMYTAVLF